MLRVNELFSGIGSQTKALTRAGVYHTVIGISEIDEPAIRSYEAIYGKTKNYGDISKIERLEDADFWTYSFPCTDISNAGKMAGITEDTRSGLLWQVKRLLEVSTLPMYLMMENVSMLLSKKFIEDFREWVAYLDGLGYDTKYALVNASKQGIPQNRVRVIAISKLRAGGGLHNFEFPPEIPLRIKLEDIIESEVDEKYYLSPERYDKILQINKGKVHIKQATKLGYIEMDLGGVCDINYPSSKTRRGRVQGGGKISPTLTASATGIVYVDTLGRVRDLTGLEYWRFMGFDDEDYYKAKEAGVTEAQLKKQAGNSIVVDVLERIFIELFREEL